jgi:peroxiredoxin
MLTSDDGDTFNLRHAVSSMGKNEILIFSFFSVTCIPCKKELPALQKLYNNYKDKKFKIFLINPDNPKTVSGEDVKSYLKDLSVTLPVLYDPFRSASKNYGILNKGGEAILPALFGVNSARKIVFKEIGYKKTTIRKLIRLIKKVK